MSSQVKDNKRQGRGLALLLAFMFFISFFPLISSAPVGSSTEAREIHVARIVFEQNEWILPNRNGLLPSKPPLYHWCVAALGHLTGKVDHFEARVVSLLFAAGTLFISVSLAISFFPQYRWAAFMAALILGSSYQFVRIAVDARVDMAFCFFVMLAAAFILRPLSPLEIKYSLKTVLHSQKDFIFFYLSCFFAVLSKGPLGVVLPCLIAFIITGVAYGFKRSFQVWFENRLGIYIFTLLAPLWYFLAFAKAGSEFINRQLIFENIGRFFGEKLTNYEPFWYYVPSFTFKAFPWSLVFICFLLYALYCRLRSKGLMVKAFSSGGLSLIEKASWLWFFVCLLFFSIAVGKRHSYLVPLFPAVMFFIIGRLQSVKFSPQVSYLEKLKISLLIFLHLGALSLVLSRYFFYYQGPISSITMSWLSDNQVPLALSCLLPYLLKVIFNIFKAGAFWTRDVVLLISIYCVFSISLATGNGIKNSIKDFHGAADAINERLAKDAKIYVVREQHEEFLDPLLYYLHRNVEIVLPSKLKKDCGNYYIFQWKYVELEEFQDPRFSRLLQYLQVVDRLKNKKDRTIFLYHYNCDYS